jgi:hypothetical protein
MLVLVTLGCCQYHNFQLPGRILRSTLSETLDTEKSWGAVCHAPLGPATYETHYSSEGADRHEYASSA